MKKFFAILTIMFSVAMTVNAQMLTTTLPKGTTYVNIATDYTLTAATQRYWQINTTQDYYTAQAVIVQMDTLPGTHHTNVAVQLYGRYGANDSWATIGSAVNWKCSGADTTIVILNATENGYRQFKLNFTGTGAGATSRVKNMEFKQWFGLP